MGLFSIPDGYDAESNGSTSGGRLGYRWPGAAYHIVEVSLEPYFRRRDGGRASSFHGSWWGSMGELVPFQHGVSAPLAFTESMVRSW